MTVDHAAPQKSREVHAHLPRQDRHKPKCGPVRPSKSSRKRAYVLIGVHVLIALHFLHWGLTGRSVTPVEPSESMETLEAGRINAGFVLFVSLILSTLVFGRWFCGWACHVVALQDLCAWLLGRVGLKPRPVRSRLLVLAPFAVAFYMFVWPQIGLLLAGATRPDLHWELTTDDLWRTFPKWIMGPATLLVVGFLIVWWLGAKGFCTHGCPYGAVFALADRFAPMRIVVTDACDACGHCTSVCTSNVRVHEEVAKHGKIVDPGCMKCMDCVSVCPKEALYFGLAAPQPFAVSQQRISARSDFTWPEEIALAGIAFTAAQWTFRGAWFGEGVPLLMAVGLGVITAVLTLLCWRLLRRPEVTFQHTQLKAAGRFTRAGRWILLALGAWLLFTAHTFVGQRLKASAMGMAEGPLREFMYVRAGVPRQQFEAALERVEVGLAWDLADDPLLLEVRALLLRALDRHIEAEAGFYRAKGSRATLSLPEANLALARYCMDSSRRKFAEAEALLQHVIATRPDNPVAPVLMQQLQSLK